MVLLILESNGIDLDIQSRDLISKLNEPWKSFICDALVKSMPKSAGLWRPFRFHALFSPLSGGALLSSTLFWLRSLQHLESLDKRFRGQTDWREDSHCLGCVGPAIPDAWR